MGADHTGQCTSARASATHTGGARGYRVSSLAGGQSTIRPALPGLDAARGTPPTGHHGSGRTVSATMSGLGEKDTRRAARHPCESWTTSLPALDIGREGSDMLRVDDGPHRTRKQPDHRPPRAPQDAEQGVERGMAVAGNPSIDPHREGRAIRRVQAVLPFRMTVEAHGPVAARTQRTDLWVPGSRWARLSSVPMRTPRATRSRAAPTPTSCHPCAGSVARFASR